MVFGFFIDVPIIVGGFLLMLFYRRQLTKALANVPIPVFVTGILLSVPLIILEEQIDCMRSWCGQVLIPPTLPFLFVEVIIVGLIALRIHAASAVRVVSVYSVFGVLGSVPRWTRRRTVPDHPTLRALRLDWLRFHLAIANFSPTDQKIWNQGVRRLNSVSFV